MIVYMSLSLAFWQRRDSQCRAQFRRPLAVLVRFAELSPQVSEGAGEPSLGRSRVGRHRSPVRTLRAQGEAPVLTPTSDQGGPIRSSTLFRALDPYNLDRDRDGKYANGRDEDAHLDRESQLKSAY